MEEDVEEMDDEELEKAYRRLKVEDGFKSMCFLLLSPWNWFIFVFMVIHHISASLRDSLTAWFEPINEWLSGLILDGVGEDLTKLELEKERRRHRDSLFNEEDGK